ncbi:MAG: HAD family phosphatase [Dorea sp.]|nr:HAD family phosphatase [Dorea sp.]
MIKNIIFDVGKVLVEYDPVTFVKNRGYTKEEQEIVLNAIFRSSLWLAADRGPIETKKLIEGFAANAPGHEDLIRDAYGHAEETVWEMPYTMEWIRELKEKGYRLYVLSNYGKDLFERTRDKMPFLPYMDGAVFSHQCHLMKPEREIYQYLCDTYSLAPSESVFLDDTEGNIAGARGYGIHGIWFQGYEEAKKRLETLLGLYDEEHSMVYCAE